MVEGREGRFRLGLEARLAGLKIRTLKMRAMRYYADPGLRSVRDFDLLVRQDDVERAATLLSGLGYVAEQNLTAPSILRRMRTMNTSYC